MSNVGHGMFKEGYIPEQVQFVGILALGSHPMTGSVGIGGWMQAMFSKVAAAPPLIVSAVMKLFTAISLSFNFFFIHTRFFD